MSSAALGGASRSGQSVTDQKKQLNSVRRLAVQVSTGCALARAKLQNSPLQSYHARGVGFEKHMAEQNTIKVYMEPQGRSDLIIGRFRFDRQARPEAHEV